MVPQTANTAKVTKVGHRAQHNRAAHQARAMQPLLGRVAGLLLQVRRLLQSLLLHRLHVMDGSSRWDVGRPMKQWWRQAAGAGRTDGGGRPSCVLGPRPACWAPAKHQP